MTHKMKITVLMTTLLIISLNFTPVHSEDIKFEDYSVWLTTDSNIILAPFIKNVSYMFYNYKSSSMESSAENELMYETNLEMEEWMMDYNWSADQEVFLEEELILEDWMEEVNWNAEEEVFTEDELKFEGWMSNPESWNKLYTENSFNVLN